MLKLREMGNEQILNRLKEIQDGSNISSDILAIILQTHRKITLKLIKKNY